MNPTSLSQSNNGQRRTKAEASEIRKYSKKLCLNDTKQALAAGQLLYTVGVDFVLESGTEVPLWMYWGFPSLQDFAESEMGIAKNRALELSRLWWVFGVQLQGLPADGLASLGRGKVLLLMRMVLLAGARNDKVAPPTEEESANLRVSAAELQKLYRTAKESSVTRLTEIYRDSRMKLRELLGLDGGADVALHNFHARVTEGELVLIEKGIQKARKAGLGKRKGMLLGEIVREWMVTQASAPRARVARRKAETIQA